VSKISSRSVQGVGFPSALHIPTDRQTKVRSELLEGKNKLCAYLSPNIGGIRSILLHSSEIGFLICSICVLLFVIILNRVNVIIITQTEDTLLIFLQSEVEMGPDPTQPNHTSDPQQIRGRPAFEPGTF